MDIEKLVLLPNVVTKEQAEIIAKLPWFLILDINNTECLCGDEEMWKYSEDDPKDAGYIFSTNATTTEVDNRLKRWNIHDGFYIA